MKYILMQIGVSQSIVSTSTSLLLLSGGQQPLDQPDHRGDKVLEGVELVRPGVQHEVCKGPHGVEAHLEAGVISNGPVEISKLLSQKNLSKFDPKLIFSRKIQLLATLPPCGRLGRTPRRPAS